MATTTTARLGLAALLTTGVFALGLQATHAKDPGSLYAGLQFSAATLEDEADFELDALIGRFGYVFSDTLRVEARLGTGLGDDTQDFTINGSPFRGTYSLDNFAGAYSLFTLPVDRAVFYAAAGFTSASADVTVETRPPLMRGRATESASETSGSWGLGVEYQIADNVWIGGEYMRYFSDLDALSLGVSVAF